MLSGHIYASTFMALCRAQNIFFHFCMQKVRMLITLWEHVRFGLKSNTLVATHNLPICKDWLAHSFRVYHRLPITHGVFKMGHAVTGTVPHFADPDQTMNHVAVSWVLAGLVPQISIWYHDKIFTAQYSKNVSNWSYYGSKWNCWYVRTLPGWDCTQCMSFKRYHVFGL